MSYEHGQPYDRKRILFRMQSYSKKILNFIFIPGFRLLFFWDSRPSLGHQILRSKFQTFLKVFEKNDGKVILMSTNIIMGQLNIKDYEYDNGITIFWLCENLRTHFHLRLFDPWYDKEHRKILFCKLAACKHQVRHAASRKFFQNSHFWPSYWSRIFGK